MVYLFQEIHLEAQLIKNPPAMQETWVRFLGWKDPLEKGTGYPLLYPGLKNSMECIVHGVATSQTQLSDFHFTASLVAQQVKNLPAMQETWVRFLGWEDPLEKGTATHFSILSWRISWTV